MTKASTLYRHYKLKNIRARRNLLRSLSLHRFETCKTQRKEKRHNMKEKNWESIGEQKKVENEAGKNLITRSRSRVHWSLTGHVTTQLHRRERVRVPLTMSPFFWKDCERRSDCGKYRANIDLTRLELEWLRSADERLGADRSMTSSELNRPGTSVLVQLAVTMVSTFQLVNFENRLVLEVNEKFVTWINFVKLH